MSAPETLAELCGVPRDEEGPVFAEPWQAKGFSMVVALHEKGHLSWSDWTAALSAEIAAAPDDDYYDCWLAALEKMAVAKGLIASNELVSRLEKGN